MQFFSIQLIEVLNEISPENLSSNRKFNQISPSKRLYRKRAFSSGHVQMTGTWHLPERTEHQRMHNETLIE